MLIRFSKKAKKYFDSMQPFLKQKFAVEFIKKLVLAWDPHYTKVTTKEAKEIEEAKQEILNGEYVDVNFS